MEFENIFNNMYSELDDVASFISFNRKNKVNAIKKKLEACEELVKNNAILKSECKALKSKNTSLVQEHTAINIKHNDLSKEHLVLHQAHDDLSKEHLVLNQTHDELSKEHLVLNQTHDELSKEHLALNQAHDELSKEHLALNQAHDELSKEHLTLSQTHNEVTTKFDLICNVLGAKSIDNQSMMEFEYLVENDFLEFANQESSLAEEAKALLMLQNIQRELQMISSFPSIYNQNIVAVGGGFSAGKSEFISSFFADKTIKLPIGIKPVTAIPTYISNGNEHIIKGYSYKGGSVDISSKLYAELSHDFIKSFRFNLKDIVPMMAIETKIKDYNNICFIDTPGYNPSNTGTTGSDYQTASEYLESANVLLWVIGLDASDGAIPASDLDFLEELGLENKKLFIIANKADLKSPEDLEDILDNFEDMLDEYDIEYSGVSAYNSIGEKEISFRRESLIGFLQDIDSPVRAKQQIMLELDKVFDMYKKAIEEQLKWTKNIQSDLRSLELDFMQDGMDIYESKRANKRLEKIRETFKTSRLNGQLKELNKLRNKMTLSAGSVFKSIDLVN